MRTLVFTVHEPPTPALDRIERAEGMEFVRDGFSSLAAAIPPLWMALNRLWLALLLYLLVSLGASLGLAAAGVDKSLIALINLAANIVIGFEASSLQRWTLGRRGWSEIGTVLGRNRADCERRFFDQWLEGQPLLRRPLPPAVPATAGTRPARLLQPATAPAGQAAADLAAGSGFGPAPIDGTARHPAEPAARPLWRRLFGR